MLNEIVKKLEKIFKKTSSFIVNILITIVLILIPFFIAITEGPVPYLIVSISFLGIYFGWVISLIVIFVLVFMFKKKPKKTLSLQHILLFFCGWYFILTFLIFLFLYNIQLPLQFLLLSVSLYFVYFFLRIKEGKKIKFEETLTYAILFFTIIQIWLAFYNNAPIIYFSSGHRCLPSLKVDKNRETVYTITLGNYGKWPAIIHYKIENISNCIVLSSKEGGLTLPSIEFQKGEQTRIRFRVKIINASESVEFKVQMNIYGSDIISRTFAGIKMFLRDYIPQSEVHCVYVPSNESMFVLGE